MTIHDDPAQAQPSRNVSPVIKQFADYQVALARWTRAVEADVSAESSRAARDEVEVALDRASEAAKTILELKDMSPPALIAKGCAAFMIATPSELRTAIEKEARGPCQRFALAVLGRLLT